MRARLNSVKPVHHLRLARKSAWPIRRRLLVAAFLLGGALVAGFLTVVTQDRSLAEGPAKARQVV